MECKGKYVSYCIMRKLKSYKQLMWFIEYDYKF